MRVYGASPLYNYVELVFRSKRLELLMISIIKETPRTSKSTARTFNRHAATKSRRPKRSSGGPSDSPNTCILS